MGGLPWGGDWGALLGMASASGSEEPSPYRLGECSLVPLTQRPRGILVAACPQQRWQGKAGAGTGAGLELCCWEAGSSRPL